MKITNKENSRLVHFYEEKLQKICRFKITDIYISYYGYLCIICSNNCLYYSEGGLGDLLEDILICSKTIIKLLSSNDIYEIALGLNLL